MSDSGPYKIFISYRRDDSQATVDHIYDRLKVHFGRDAIFMDVDSIPVGYSFPGYVKSVLRQRRIALIVIGPAWLSLLSNDGPYKGQPRLADPADLVRIEVEQTLALASVNDDGRPTSDLLLIPVLVQGARMPHAEELPASLRAGRAQRDPDSPQPRLRPRHQLADCAHQLLDRRSPSVVNSDASNPSGAGSHGGHLTLISSACCDASGADTTSPAA